MVIRFNYDLLIEVMKRDGATLDLSVYTDKTKLNSKVKIQGVCKCGQSFCKSFTLCYENGGMFCKSCVFINANTKRSDTYFELTGFKNSMQNPKTRKEIKETLKERTGYENPMQNPETKEKHKQNMKNKTGYEYALQNPNTKEKCKQTLKDKTGFENPMQNPETKEKYKETLKERTGFENPMHNPETKEKYKQNMKERTGYEYPMQNPETKEKRKQNMKERTGFENPMQNPETREKCKETLKKRTGFENPTQNPETKEKVKQTLKERTGYENPMHNPESQEKQLKASYYRKEFQMPSGDIRMVQGYEPQALTLLLQNYQEEDILTGAANVPEIWYTSDKEHRHYVDIYIKSINTCIEVKSTWTYEKDKENIHLKQQEGKNLGMKYEIWIMDKKGDLLEKIE